MIQQLFSLFVIKSFYNIPMREVVLFNQKLSSAFILIYTIMIKRRGNVFEAIRIFKIIHGKLHLFLIPVRNYNHHEG